MAMAPINLTTISWQISTVEIAGYSTWSSLAFSPSGQAAVAYFSSINSALRFATQNPDGTWAVGTVDTVSGDCAPSLRFRFSQAAISYCVGFKELRYALNRGGNPPWTINFAGSGGYDNSLAIGPSHRPCISFAQKGGGLGYTQSDANASTWVGTTVDGMGNGGFNSLAFTASGQPAIAYSFSDSHGHDLIKYAEFDGAHWSHQPVGPGPGWCTLAFTPSGQPAIAYPNSLRADSAVMYAVLSGGSWDLQTVASGADSPSLAFTPAGEPAISYHSRGGALNYAVLIDRVWNSFVVDTAGKDPTGQLTGDFTLTSLAFSPSGQPAISYYDRANGGIKCALGTVSARVKGGGLISLLHGRPALTPLAEYRAR
jgi:hypothetical protein